MPEPITKLADQISIAKDIKNLYALVTKIQKDMAALAVRISALESPP